MSKVMDLQLLTDLQLEALISRRYLSAERIKEFGPVTLGPKFWKLTRSAMNEYERRHPLPPKCWYGMKAKHGYPAAAGDLWVPWLCGNPQDLPLPAWVRLITAWTDLLGWRVIDLYEDYGITYLKNSILCWLRTGHRFSPYVGDGKVFNNPFGGSVPYSNCVYCPACVRRDIEDNGWEALPPERELT